MHVLSCFFACIVLTKHLISHEEKVKSIDSLGCLTGKKKMEQLWKLNNVGNTYAHIELSHITGNRIDLAGF